MTIQGLAAEMGVSERDAAAFVEGVRVHMRRGRGLDDAIRAHAATWRSIFDNAAELSVAEGRRGAMFGDMAVALACDAFYPEAR